MSAPLVARFRDVYDGAGLTGVSMLVGTRLSIGRLMLSLVAARLRGGFGGALKSNPGSSFCGELAYDGLRELRPRNGARGAISDSSAGKP